MNFSSFAPARIAAALGAVCAVTALAGCQGEKNIAHIGATSVTEKVFDDRVQHLMSSDMLPIVDAGGSALTRMILEEAVGQLAKEKNVEPTPAAVTAYNNYQVRYDPNKRRAIEQGIVTAADFESTVKYSLEVFALGVDGAKAKPEDVQKAYDQLKTQPAVGQANPMTGQPGQPNPIKIPAELTLQIVGAKDEATAAKILAQLKTDGNFKAAAQTAGITGPALDSVGQETPLPNPEQVKQQLPEAYAALTQTPAGQFVSKPIPIPNAKAPKQFLVAKVVKNNPEVVFTLEEARPLLEQIVLSSQKQDWNDHQTLLLNERLKKMLADGSIQINIPRYQNLTTKVIPLLMEESNKAMMQRAAQRAAMAAQQQAVPPPNAPRPPSAPQPVKPGATGKP